MESAISETKLERANLSSFFELPKEPNYGPFPQYNIVIEDSSLETITDLIGPKERRKYKSSLESTLRKLLDEAQHELVRLQTVVMNPRKAFKSAIPGMEEINKLRTKLNPFSLFQDHEQYIEPNVAPFQEITVHPESAVPEGSQAFDSGPVMNILDLNKTLDLSELGMLEVAETVLEKKLDFVVRTVLPPNKPPPAKR